MHSPSEHRGPVAWMARHSVAPNLLMLFLMIGGLMMAGALMDHFETKSGAVMMVTATDPAVVKKIHEATQRTIDEMKKLTEKKKG